MDLTVIRNPDASRRDVYVIARTVYAETCASSLIAVEALSAMIANAARAFNRSPYDIATDMTLFDSLHPDDTHHKYLSVNADTREFQMCLRVVSRMLRGNLPDSTYGATRFHRATILPDWAMARGYIADIDGLLFYR